MATHMFFERLTRSSRVWALIIVPTLTVGAIASGGALNQLMLIAGLQTLILLSLGRTSISLAPHERGGEASMQSRNEIEQRLAQTVRASDKGNQGAALVVLIDDADRLSSLHGRDVLSALHSSFANRLATVLREQDSYCLLETGGFGVALFPQRGLDLGSVLAVAQRIQTQLSQACEIDGVALRPTVSVGFCLSPRAATLNGMSLLSAAETAANKACQSGPLGLNSFSVVDFPAAMHSNRIATLADALETGQIHAHFQPQVRTATGQVSGLEALARWEHPDRGLISPAEFLPQIEAAGLSTKLAQRMLSDALGTLANLEKLGFSVPNVAINLSTDELRNPKLADEIAWELERHNLSPSRLTLEILETVVSHSDEDTAVKTIARLSAMGCGIDLDDFGTGHASIAHIRRFAVERIKIDRSFVTHLTQDIDQQRMVAAIMSMADQLDLATLAEGVESAEEQVMLAQMGCDHLQGFAIARPMPPQDLPQWLNAHNTALAQGEPWCEEPIATSRVAGQAT